MKGKSGMSTSLFHDESGRNSADLYSSFSDFNDSDSSDNDTSSESQSDAMSGSKSQSTSGSSTKSSSEDERSASESDNDEEVSGHDGKVSDHGEEVSDHEDSGPAQHVELIKDYTADHVEEKRLLVSEEGREGQWIFILCVAALCLAVLCGRYLERYMR